MRKYKLGFSGNNSGGSFTGKVSKKMPDAGDGACECCGGGEGYQVFKIGDKFFGKEYGFDEPREINVNSEMLQEACEYIKENNIKIDGKKG